MTNRSALTLQIAVELRKSGHFGKLNKNARTAYATVAFK